MSFLFFFSYKSAENHDSNLTNIATAIYENLMLQIDNRPTNIVIEPSHHHHSPSMSPKTRLPNVTSAPLIAKIAPKLKPIMLADQLKIRIIFRILAEFHADHTSATPLSQIFDQGHHIRMLAVLVVSMQKHGKFPSHVAVHRQIPSLKC
jgi:hypothetical protein